MGGVGGGGLVWTGWELVSAKDKSTQWEKTQTFALLRLKPIEPDECIYKLLSNSIGCLSLFSILHKCIH